MSKFCGNCGAQLDDAAKVCGNCGTPLESNKNNNSSIPGVSYIDPEKKAKNQKLIKNIIVLVAFVLVAIIAINIISGFVGYKGVIRKTMNAYKNYDIDTLVSLTSDLRLEAFDYIDDNYAEEYYEDFVSDDLDYYEDTVGRKYKISYEIVETYKLSDRKFDNLLDSFISYVDYVEDYDISKVMAAEIKITAKEGKKSTTSNMTLYLAKENGSWKILQFGNY